MPKSKAEHSASAYQWNKDHPERFAESRRRYQEKNAARLAEKARLKRALDGERINEQRRSRYVANSRDKQTGWELKSRYGITLEEYRQRLEEQGGVCASCGKLPGKNRLHVDHCHEKNLIRGLLCSNCNTAIGLMGDSVVNLQAAIEYLNYSRGEEIE